jgi:hypothetical protein
MKQVIKKVILLLGKTHTEMLDLEHDSGADPEFQVRGGDALKKIAPSGGRRENV